MNSATIKADGQSTMIITAGKYAGIEKPVRPKVEHKIEKSRADTRSAATAMPWNPKALKWLAIIAMWFCIPALSVAIVGYAMTACRLGRKDLRNRILVIGFAHLIIGYVLSLGGTLLSVIPFILGLVLIRFINRELVPLYKNHLLNGGGSKSMLLPTLLSGAITILVYAIIFIAFVGIGLAYEVHLENAENHHNSGEYIAAAEILEELIEMDPYDSRAYILLSYTYSADGKYSEAVEVLEQSKTKIDYDLESLTFVNDLSEEIKASQEHAEI